MGQNSKMLSIVGWILGGLPAVFMLVTAVWGLTHMNGVTKHMEDYGYPAGSAAAIIVVEIACVILYLVPNTAVLGAILLVGYLGGATSTHVRAGEPFVMPVAFGILFWIGLYLRDARVRALVPNRK